MDIGTMMTIGSIAAPIVGGIIGNQAAKGDKEAQKQAMKAALAELNKIGSPPDLSRRLILEEFQRQGIYTPEMEQEISVAESEMGQLKEDPSLREANMGALQRMLAQSKSGLTAEDRAALNQARSEVQRDTQSKLAQITQQMQARGQAGSGMELAMQLQAAQGGADQAAAGADTLMAQAQQRALQALGKSSDMASQMRGQDLDVNSSKARAIDERNRFLAENSVARQSRNVGALNQAQQANLAEQQRINDANIAMRNAETQRQTQAERDLFNDKLNLAQAKSGQRTQQAGFYGQQAGQTAQQWANIGSGVGGGLATLAQKKG